METVIRSPQDGVVKKLAHKEGVSIHISTINFGLWQSNTFHRISAKQELFWYCSRRNQSRRKHKRTCMAFKGMNLVPGGDVLSI